MEFNCPQCGELLDLSTDKSIKLSSCPSCNSSLLIENDTISLSALNVVKYTKQSLFNINNNIQVNDKVFTPKGYCLYQYDEGKKVEWELIDDEEQVYFLNQEDENLFLVKQIPHFRKTLPNWEALQPNTHFKIKDQDWLVVERLRVSFESYFGDLHNLPEVDQQFDCTYMSNTEGECLVIVWKDNAHRAFQGWWLDPLDIQ